MRIVSLRPVHLRVRICPLRWRTMRRASHNWFAVWFETVVEKRSMALDVVSIIGLSLRRS